MDWSNFAIGLLTAAGGLVAGIYTLKRFSIEAENTQAKTIKELIQNQELLRERVDVLEKNKEKLENENEELKQRVTELETTNEALKEALDGKQNKRKSA